MTFTNWAGNVVFGARRVHRPGSVAEVARLVAGAERVRALGTGHSFNRIADTAGDLVSVAGLPRRVEIDAARSAVTVSAGLRYGEFVRTLDEAGFALPNLGSLPHISVAGAVATGTHGSGVRNGSLATAVAGLELVTADGQVAGIRRGEPDFAGMVVGLGGVGVVTAVTLDLVPAFEIAQYVYEDLPVERFTEDAAEILGAGYSVSLFTRWRTDRIDQVWLKGPHETPELLWHGASRATVAMHPVPGMPARHCTEQLGVSGPWYRRLPHFRLEFTPSSGRELQSEFFVPVECVTEAFAALDDMRDRIAPVLRIGEIRTVAGDELWLSPAAGRDSAAFHFTWIDDPAAVTPVVAAIEERLARFGARPHWGKVFTAGPDRLRGRYDRWADFARLLDGYDPAGKFRNDFLDRFFPRAGTPAPKLDTRPVGE
ncbi:FAD-binding protein [Nocardia aurantia]|uniref:Putative xylitol oxidase n=1 Tax=Nocardia aurantia TaxID=2585199 RepID=A0A7K0DXG7_9NOCA|nr:FAD-binding protein [Nocardia aurantia]MQY30483.1 putative xylitol oxidase [Nocardia aurantia]